MDLETCLTMLINEKKAYAAFLDLKRNIGAWKEVSDFAQKIVMLDEKILLVKSLEAQNATAAQDLLQRETQNVANQLKAKANARQTSRS